MNDDPAAQELLVQVAEEWEEAGVLDVLCDLVRQVWRADLDRYEPDTMGDDLMSLGVQASRNLCNLAVRELRDVPGVLAQNRKTLEVAYGGRVLHAGKAPSDSPDWNVNHVDWAESDVRESAAAANSAAYQSTAGTLFEILDLPGQRIDPAALRHLHLTWQGFPDGGTRTWLGFPQLGLRPWYAVMMVDDARDAGTGVGPAGIAAPQPPVPDFDDLGEPEVRVIRRPRPVKKQGA